MKLPPIYAINLDRDVERWRRMEKVTRAAGLQNVQRFSAVNVRKMNETTYRESTTWLGRHFQPPGVLGCALSHISLWKKIVEENIPVAIIMEDDVELVLGFKEKLISNILKLRRLYPKVPFAWPHGCNAMTVAKSDEMTESESFDVILLGGLGRVHPQGKDSFASRLFASVTGGCQTHVHKSDSLYRPIRPAGTHAYMISQEGAKKLLLSCYKARYHIDIDAWGQKNVEVLMFNPMLAYQSFDSSTLVESSKASYERNDIFQKLWHATEISSLLPQSLRDPFTRQTWKHALSEPAFQFTEYGPVIRNDQCVAVIGTGILLTSTLHMFNRTVLSKSVLTGTLSVAVLIKILLVLLLNSNVS